MTGVKGARGIKEQDLFEKLDYVEFQWLQGLLTLVAPKCQRGTRSENNLWN